MHRPFRYVAWVAGAHVVLVPLYLWWRPDPDLPYLAALGETKLAREQAARVRSELDEKTGLYGRPPTYYDQNLMLFALGFNERHFWFDARGRLRTRWSDER